jgi:hypothetical protein
MILKLGSLNSRSRRGRDRRQLCRSRRWGHADDLRGSGFAAPFARRVILEMDFDVESSREELLISLIRKSHDYSFPLG